MAACAVIAALCLPLVHNAAAQTTTPGMAQVDLTVDSSLRTLQAWEAMKAMGDEIESDDVNQLQGLYIRQKFINLVTSHGFPDVETWHRTLYTFLLSAGSIGKEDQFAKMPENLKEMMAHLMPRPENISVAKQALENPEVARIYGEVK